MTNGELAKLFFLLMPFGTRLFQEPFWMMNLAFFIFALFLFTRIIGGIGTIRITEFKTKTILNLILFDRVSSIGANSM